MPVHQQPACPNRVQRPGLHGWLRILHGASSTIREANAEMPPVRAAIWFPTVPVIQAQTWWWVESLLGFLNAGIVPAPSLSVKLEWCRLHPANFSFIFQPIPPG